VNNGSVQGTKGGAAYWIYAQACPSGTSTNGAKCSLWALVDTSQVTTTAYPSSVFAVPIKPTDATVNSIAARTNVPAGDVSNVSVINLTINDAITPGNSQVLSAITYVGNTNPYIVNSSLFTNGFKPNNKYVYTGQVQYPWDLVPTAAAGGPQSEGPFWTTPSNPGPVSVSNVTHCSVQITAQNSSGAANPGYTEYSLCATSACNFTGRILSNPSVSVTIAPLSPNTIYTPNATALVGMQDGSEAGWSNSGVTNGANFTTKSWGSAFTSSIANITTTSADYTFSSLDTTGVVSYQVMLNGVGQGTVNGVPTSPIHLAGLTPNRQYTVALQLSESVCASPTIGQLSFTTTAVAPTSFQLSVASAYSLTASWTDGVNAAGTLYSIQYCTDSGFTQNCNAVPANSSPATLTGLSPETQYFAHVKALSAGGGSDSSYSNSASATTLDSNPTVSINAGTVGTNSVPLTAVVSKNGGDQNFTYSWTVLQSPGGITSFTPNANASLVTFNFTSAAGQYKVQLVVTDHNGSGPGTGQATFTFTPGHTPTSITIAPSPTTVGTGGTANFTATVYDQTPAVMPGEVVNWTLVEPAAGTLSSASGVGTTFTAGTIPGTYHLKATDGSATQTAQVTVVLNAMVVSCNNAVLGTGSTANCTAVVNNPVTGNPLVPQPAITWSIDAPAGANTIVGSGGTAVFTANSAGTAIVRATSASTGDTGSFTINVSPTAPQIGSVTPTVYVTSVSIAIQATVFGNHPMSYQCAADPTSPSGAITFPAASNTSTVFGAATGAGSFIVNCTVTDTTNGVTSQKVTPLFSVSQVLTSLKVCAAGDTKCSSQITLQTLQNQQFNATGSDQFGNSMTVGSIRWTSNGGNVAGSGSSINFSGSSVGQTIRITAISGGATGFVDVNLINFDVSGAFAYPVPYKASFGSGVINFKNLGTQAKIRIYTASGRKVFEKEVDNCATDAICYQWDVKNSSGESLASGVYFYVIESSKNKKDGKLIIIK